jgi:hypothetical protein
LEWWARWDLAQLQATSAKRVAASVDSDTAIGKAFASISAECAKAPEGCADQSVYMYSVENSAVSEAMSGMRFLSMNAR